jgi:SAM-dependent methyltransferase
MKKEESRSLEQLREQYEIEKKLAETLRRARKEERRRVYREVYNKLFHLVPHHPQLTRRVEVDQKEKHVISQMRILQHFLGPTVTFLEIGAGDCSLSLEVSKFVKKVFAVEISETLGGNVGQTKNFEMIITDGTRIPLPQNSVDVVYSNQLIEHLHPEDVLEHIQDVHRVLVSGGVYICVTPNRLNGPHDISKYFDNIATGLHLKEYTNTGLESIFKRTNFRKVKTVYLVKGIFLLVPSYYSRLVEQGLTNLPLSLMKRIARLPIFKVLLGIKLLAIK